MEPSKFIATGKLSQEKLLTHFNDAKKVSQVIFSYLNVNRKSFQNDLAS